jgi:ATP-dependent Lon protease
LDEVPDEIKREIDFVFVSQMSQVIDAALEERPLPRRASTLDGAALAASMAH